MGIWSGLDWSRKKLFVSCNGQKIYRVGRSGIFFLVGGLFFVFMFKNLCFMLIGNWEQLIGRAQNTFKGIFLSKNLLA